MINIPKVPGFAEQLGLKLGQGLGEGAGSILQSLGKRKQLSDIEKKYAKPSQSKMAPQASQLPLTPEERSLQFKEQVLPNVEKTLGKKLNPLEINQLWEDFDAQQDEQERMSQAESDLQTEEEDSNSAYERLMSMAREYQNLGNKDAAKIAKDEAAAILKRQQEEYEPEKAGRTEFLKKRYDSTSKYLDEMQQKRKQLQQDNSSILMMEEALSNPQPLAGLQDWLSKVTGIDNLQSASGAVLKKAIKDYFLADLKSLSGQRANMFIEKQLVDALPKMGYDETANAIILEAVKLKRDLDQAEIDIADELKESMVRPDGTLPINFQDIVEKKSSARANELTEAAHNRIKSLSAIMKSGEIKDLSPANAALLNGTTVEDPETGELFISDGKKFVPYMGG
jgi:hypothetical protein